MDGLDKPVHEALLDYDLLNVHSVQENNAVNLPTAKPWRMNLCAASERDPCTFFVAMGQYVQVYQLDNFGATFRNPVRMLATPTPRQGQDLGMDTINQIKVGKIFDTEVVVTVSDAGDIWIWRTDALDEPPMTINNDGSSTWGLAIHGDQGLIAVSANSWTVTVYNIGEITRIDPIFGKRRRSVRPVMEGLAKRELNGHTDNIPCVDFNQSGRYLASCSIDQTCRLWDLQTGEQATIRKLDLGRRDNESWCWSVKFVSQRDFKVSQCMDHQISQQITKRVRDGRSTALSGIGMRNSAALPVYRLNLEGLDGLHAFIPESDENDDDDDGDFLLTTNDERRRSSFADLPHEVRVPAAQLQQLELGPEPLEAIRARVQDFRQLLASGPFESSQESEDEEFVAQEDYDQDTVTPTNWQYDERDIGLPENQDIMDWLSDEEPNNDEPFLRRLPGGHRLLRPDEHRALEERMVAERAAAGPFRFRNVQPEIIPITSQGGWSDSEPEDESCIQVPRSVIEQDEYDGAPRKRKIRQVMRCPTPSSPSPAMDQFLNKPKEGADELIMLTTPRDIVLLHTTSTRMSTERWERNVISNVDVRTDRLLVAMDRLNMVEWIPELELYVAASQKGTVALMRVVKVELGNGQSTLIFNTEKYLPDSGLRSNPLYGMTVRKAVHDRMTLPSYLIYLFYYDGCVLGYRVSRRADQLFAEPLI
ncbi:hypothetical protein BJV82DRAFT_588447 [Fennellomyces sp. T-0311]|nr:hypothetical protein BJV82DRAFT_588447 [Fennellomyces sp. T-0311]